MRASLLHMRTVMSIPRMLHYTLNPLPHMAFSCTLPLPHRRELNPNITLNTRRIAHILTFINKLVYKPS